jgi:DNA-binding MarR family transcriptional regulator
MELVLKPHGVSLTRFEVLRLLSVKPHTRTQLMAGITHSRSADLTRNIDQMITLGLVTRARGTVDGRQAITTITSAGAQLYQQLAVELDAHFGKLADAGGITVTAEQMAAIETTRANIEMAVKTVNTEGDAN